jgi:hypothetical protein
MSGSPFSLQVRFTTVKCRATATGGPGEHHTVFATMFAGDRGKIEPVYQCGGFIKHLPRGGEGRHRGFIPFLPGAGQREAIEAWVALRCAVAIAMGTKPEPGTGGEGIPPLVPESLAGEHGHAALGDQLVEHAL